MLYLLGLCTTLNPKPKSHRLLCFFCVRLLSWLPWEKPLAELALAAMALKPCGAYCLGHPPVGSLPT